jgi:hypothetical protein
MSRYGFDRKVGRLNRRRSVLRRRRRSKRWQNVGGFGQRTFRPFDGVGLEGIDLIALQTLQFGSFAGANNSLHALVAAWTTVHENILPFFAQRWRETKVPRELGKMPFIGADGGRRGRASIKRVKMVDRPVAEADVEPIGGCDRGTDPGLGATNSGFQVVAFRKARRDGR